MVVGGTEWVWREGGIENKGMRGRSSPGGGLVVSFSIIVFGSLVAAGSSRALAFPSKRCLLGLQRCERTKKLVPAPQLRSRLADRRSVQPQQYR